MHPHFHSQNYPSSSERIVVHPYIYSRTSTTVQIGVYCESPAPESAMAVVRFTLSGFPVSTVSVPITKGMTDSGVRSSISFGTSSFTTKDFYKYANATIISFNNSDLFISGSKDLCPTLLFRVHLHADSSITTPLIGSQYFNGFSESTISFVPNTTLLTSSEISDVCVLKAGVNNRSFDAEVKISRAPALMEGNDILKIVADSYPYFSPAGCTWVHYNTIQADELKEVIEAKYVYDSPFYFSVALGAPTLGELIKLGVTVFDINLFIRDVCFN